MEYDKNLYGSLESIASKYEEINKKLESPSISVEEMREANKVLKHNKAIYEKFLLYKKLIDNALQAERMLVTNDPDLVEMAKLELEEIKGQIPTLQEELKFLLIPKNPNNEKDVSVEMRPGAGGDEACIFVADLFDTYKRYADMQKWQLKVNDSSYNAHGCDHIFFTIKGSDVYSKFKFESGVHRVQRVPLTETKGRVHTSTITVAVLPEIEAVEFSINHSDLRIDTYRASGAGGQHVNRTESAVRITHLPTNIVVACQEGRSQIENRETCMTLLRSKLWQKSIDEQNEKISSLRKSQVGSGGRSEKIRTYNYPQNRITDHRINLTLNKLEIIMQGNLSEITTALLAHEQEELIKEFNDKQ